MSSQECRIYDLLEYKLKRYVDSFRQGSDEWHTAMQILLLYLDGEVSIKWSSDIIYVVDNKTNDTALVATPVSGASPIH